MVIVLAHSQPRSVLLTFSGALRKPDHKLRRSNAGSEARDIFHRFDKTTFAGKS